MNSPCKDCEDRHRNCHAHCDEYKAYHADNVRRNEERRRDQEVVKYKKQMSEKVEQYLFQKRRK